jgi:hypothetical protein
MEGIIGRRDRTIAGEDGLTPRGKKMVESVLDEARRLNHRDVGTEHLLRVTPARGGSHRSRMLTRFGVRCEGVREQVVRRTAEVPTALRPIYEPLP